MNASMLTLPILAWLLQNQRLCQMIVIAAGLHLALVHFNLPSWPCPIRHGLGVPCPSCGLSRALVALMTGQWQQAIALHAFAPVVVVLLLLIGYGSLAPMRVHRAFVQRVAGVEQRTGLTAVILGLFCLYWLVRLLFWRDALYQLIL